MMDKLMTLADVEGLTRRKVSTLRTDIREGRLKAVRLGRQVRITEQSLRAFLAGQQGAKKAMSGKHNPRRIER